MTYGKGLSGLELNLAENSILAYVKPEQLTHQVNTKSIKVKNQALAHLNLNIF